MGSSKNSESSPLVGILMGSDSDLPVMGEAAKMLKKFGVPFELEISSAHRSPERTRQYATTAIERGLKAVIVGAGGAAHLAGVIAAETTLPVIAVPLSATSLGGLDALLSSVQMPRGIPVGVMAIGAAGAVNAAIFACEIIAGSDANLAGKLLEYRKELARGVAEKSEKAKREFEG